MNVNIIVAASSLSMGIGKNNSIPWKLPADMRHFKEMTLKTKDPDKKNVVIMGRKTWQSIPKKFRPLSGRINVVVTGDPEYREKYDISEDIYVMGAESFIEFAKDQKGKIYDIDQDIYLNIEDIFIIGGNQVYKDVMEKDLVDVIYFTSIIDPIFECDTYFPSFNRNFDLIEQGKRRIENGITFAIHTYGRNGNDFS